MKHIKQLLSDFENRCIEAGLSTRQILLITPIFKKALLSRDSENKEYYLKMAEGLRGKYKGDGLNGRREDLWGDLISDLQSAIKKSNE